MARRRFGRARKRAYFWLGSQNSVTVTAAATLVFDLYVPSEASLADSKSLRLESVICWISVQSSDATLRSLSFGLQHVPTDLSLAAGNILDPRSTDVDLFNKKQLLWGGRVMAPPNTQQPLLIYERIKSKRRLDAAQDSLVMSFRSTGADVLVQAWFRSLFSKPA